jgi:hypothetical protein
MVSKRIVPTLKQKYRRLRDELDERALRVWVETEARALGHGGITAVARGMGLSISRIRRGIEELSQARRSPAAERRVRRDGGVHRDDGESECVGDSISELR